MKPLILVVEDNLDLLYNLNILLESNNYKPITAKNGKEAIEILSNLEEIPDVIISDIMMPEMDGYEFFKIISNEPRWNRIPFLFLSALINPKDIRFGRLLGVDDYLTKPFDEKDLLAILSGRIARNKRINALNKKINESFSTTNLKMNIPIEDQKERFICLFLAFWDDKTGPELNQYFPEEKVFPIPLDDIVNQLFTVATSIYGHDKITKAEGVLLDIKNLNTRGYLFFDSYPDKKERFGEKQYMIAVIAPSINYFHTLEIKEIFTDLSKKIKKKTDWNIEEYWEKIYDIMLIDPIKSE
ncbi:MAG TPA: response regulator [Candidatus Nanopelagicaceae bacterium]|nr:response regulator [Candidatus Nanopelagicaceae bacterium]